MSLSKGMVKINTKRSILYLRHDILGRSGPPDNETSIPVKHDILRQPSARGTSIEQKRLKNKET